MNTKKYRIYTIDGHNYGTHSGDSEIEALASMHNDAGYPCYVLAGEDEITFHQGCNLGADGQDICGQLDDWDVREVQTGERS